MTQVIHCLTREQLIKRVFGEHKPAQRDSRSDNGGKCKNGEAK
ncbi:hypothetical protein [Candidatus Pantoea communis]|nr:hypothetical protein [Pantoea communis]